MYGKWLVECMQSDGVWIKFNYFTCTLSEVNEKSADILMKTNYYGVKYTLLK